MAEVSESFRGPVPRCPICGETTLLELCDPSGIALCPRCGHLLHRLEGRLASLCGTADGINLDTSFTDDLGFDSFDIVELIVELEKEFDVTIPDAEAEQIKTVSDAIRCIEKCARREMAEERYQEPSPSEKGA